METELLTPDEAGLQKAAGLIREGQVVGMPTETVYGLAADATNRDAVAKVFAAKGRPMDNPLIVHISSMEELEQAVSRVPELVASLADAFWPGPLTMIMPKSELIPMETSGGLDTVGVRMPPPQTDPATPAPPLHSMCWRTCRDGSRRSWTVVRVAADWSPQWSPLTMTGQCGSSGRAL